MQQSALRGVSNKHDTAKHSQIDKNNHREINTEINNVPKFGENNDSANARRSVQNENDLQGNNSELINGILKQFQALQINISLPLFDPDRSNPMEFIRNFEKYSIRKNISEDDKLLIVEDALQGTVKIWFDAITTPFLNYNEFKEVFLKEFFSLEARMQVKSEWENKRFNSSNKSLQMYYNQQLKVAKFTVPKMEQYEINFIIISQLPPHVRDILSTIDYTDSDRISKTLARLDLSGGWNKLNNNYNVRNNVDMVRTETNVNSGYSGRSEPQEGTTRSGRDAGNVRQGDSRDGYRRNTSNNNWRSNNNREQRDNRSQNSFGSNTSVSHQNQREGGANESAVRSGSSIIATNNTNNDNNQLSNASANIIQSTIC